MRWAVNAGMGVEMWFALFCCFIWPKTNSIYIIVHVQLQHIYKLMVEQETDQNIAAATPGCVNIIQRCFSICLLFSNWKKSFWLWWTPSLSLLPPISLHHVDSNVLVTLAVAAPLSNSREPVCKPIVICKGDTGRKANWQCQQLSYSA